jgi:hypothetical protein
MAEIQQPLGFVPDVCGDRLSTVPSAFLVEAKAPLCFPIMKSQTSMANFP